MATLNNAYSTGSAVTVTNTETSIGVTGGTTTGLPLARTDAGLFYIMVDAIANMVKGDEYLFKLYETLRSGGTRRTLFQASLKGVQSKPLIIEWVPLEIGWDATLQRISATSRAIDWRISRIS